MIRLGVLGASGRMGQWVTKLAGTEYADRFSLAVAPPSSVPVESLLATRVVIDFSSAEGMVKLAEAALHQAGDIPVFVIGSTGWDPAQIAVVRKLAERTLVVMSSNLSTGVVALLEILKMASPTLQKLGYTPVLVETHHSHKKDAPSGTALAMAKCIVSDSGDRPAQIHSIRAGEVIGDHNMTFYGPSDSITISHHAQDRSSFARGALDISAWLVSKKAKDPTLTGFLGTDAYLRDLLGGR